MIPWYICLLIGIAAFILGTIFGVWCGIISTLDRMQKIAAKDGRFEAVRRVSEKYMGPSREGGDTESYIKRMAGRSSGKFVNQDDEYGDYDKR